jgi:hypothetical protein
MWLTQAQGVGDDLGVSALNEDVAETFIAGQLREAQVINADSQPTKQEQAHHQSL